MLFNKEIMKEISIFIPMYFNAIFLIIHMLNKTYMVTENMFTNCDKSMLTYDFYKEKEVIVKNDKEALLLFILKCDLAVQDLNLYLDVKETDQEVLKMLNFYKKELKEAKEKYLNKYGPLTPCQITSSFTWNDCPFPWEV